jgi:RHS repeat-associated protein
MFAGEDVDPDTGLTYHWNHWRSEDGASFISEDPARDGSNWYNYVRNSPLVATDPSGKF